MLVIPVEGRLSWRNPPVITILLIAINCFVFFVIQASDDQRAMEAYEYYFDSGLSEIELPQYAAHVAEKTGDTPETDDWGDFTGKTIRLLTDMQRDSDFMRALYNEEIIVFGSDKYQAWHDKRTSFDNLLKRSISHRFGLTPARADPSMFVTSIFLHGSIWHLFFNMIFLWIVGCVLEMGLGRMLYCSGYILAGILSGIFYFALHHDSYLPLIGASGAISGLMGAMAALYGLTRIRVFFSTGFYFDYVRLPALLLLPFWLGKEFVSFFLDTSGNVAYMAHAGGLIGGALLGISARRVLGEDKKAFFEQQPENPVPAMIEESMERISRLDFDGARPVLHNVLAIQPVHEEAARLLYNIEKHHPDTPQFHEAAGRYLSLLLEKPAENNIDRIYTVYSEYAGMASPPKLPYPLYAHLAAAFMDAGKIDEGKKIVAGLIRSRPGLESIPALLLRMINAMKRHNMTDKAAKYRRFLCSCYPDSQEARIAAKQSPPSGKP